MALGAAWERLGEAKPLIASAWELEASSRPMSAPLAVADHSISECCFSADC